MNSIQLPSAARPAPDAFPPHLQPLLEEIARLVDARLDPAAFHAELLGRVRAALGGVAAAVWSKAEERFTLEHQVNLAAVGLDRTPAGPASHDEVLRRVVRRDRPVWVPPHAGQEPPKAGAPANLTPHGLLLAPVLLDGEAVGVLEVWLGTTPEADAREGLARFLTVAAGVVAAFVHKSQLRELQGQQQRWAQVETLAAQLHGSLDPREVAHLAANQGRLLVGCDQVAVGLRHGRAARVEAISGATAVEVRSPLVQAMAQLFDRVLAWGEKVLYQGTRDESLPPAVLQALDAYLARSNSRALLVLPLRDARDPAPGACRAALLLECFTPAMPPAALETRVTALARQAGPALYNALRYEKARANLFAKGLAGLADWTRGRRGRTLALAGGLVALGAAALTFIPAPLRLEARGQLLPKDRQVVYAARPGKIVDLKTHHGDQVQKGQELLFIEDLDAQLKVEQLNVKVAYAEQRLAALTDQLGKAASADERNAVSRERINQEYELRKAAVERDLLLQESRSPRKAPVPAPLAGKLVTFDAREQLVGKTVKPGDPLVRIARIQGPWEIELNLPEAALAAIHQGLRAAPDAALDVHLLLANQPLRTYRGRLRADGLGGETVVKDNAVVLPARVEIADPELIEQLALMPVGLEVRARIDCGPRVVGAVWFGDLLEFVYERFIF